MAIPIKTWPFSDNYVAHVLLQDRPSVHRRTRSEHSGFYVKEYGKNQTHSSQKIISQSSDMGEVVWGRLKVAEQHIQQEGHVSVHSECDNQISFLH